MNPFDLKKRAPRQTTHSTSCWLLSPSSPLTIHGDRLRSGWRSLQTRTRGSRRSLARRLLESDGRMAATSVAAIVTGRAGVGSGSSTERRSKASLLLHAVLGPAPAAAGFCLLWWLCHRQQRRGRPLRPAWCIFGAHCDRPGHRCWMTGHLGGFVSGVNSAGNWTG